ncbi:hypothetical protein K402DRAFT_420279 [Aulographum hederae CBS 113979]|uniref:WKF domain-containing protein n=1 Tax=Aulographum hederae CBS 113979 TaxID=1176131 RepID=A0A6G1H3C9_9PEZI|nr:hypothetical protein K402DRAFT_420279 [Aulographum hederae CBS 113979]
MRLPAWKKLGLELRTAPETSANVTGVAATTDSPKLKTFDNVNGNANSNSSNGVRVEVHKSSRNGKRPLGDNVDHGGNTKRSRRDSNDHLLVSSKRSSASMSAQKDAAFGPTDDQEQGMKSPQGNTQLPNGHHGLAPSDSAQNRQKASEKDHQSSGSADSPALKRKKSVAFTPETKEEDGNGARTIYHGWLGSQLQSDDKADFTPEELSQFDTAPKSHPANNGPAPEIEAKRAKKKPKNLQKASEPVAETSADFEDAKPKRDKKAIKAERRAQRLEERSKQQLPYVTYLLQFYEDREAWKFHKLQQRDLIDNTLNVFRVPHHCDVALKEYISGLQGYSLRVKIREMAQKLLAEVADPEEDRVLGSSDSSAGPLEQQLEKSTKALDNDIQHRGDQNDDLRTKLLKRRRAHLVLLALATADEKFPSKPQAPKTQKAPIEAKISLPKPNLPVVNTTEHVVAGNPVLGIARSSAPATRVKFDDDDDDAGLAKVAQPQKPQSKPARKRKQRTQVLEDSSSSSSSDSDSDSTEGSHAKKATSRLSQKHDQKAKPIRKRKQRTAAEHPDSESSSDGDSTSSADSTSDDSD